MPVPEYFFIHPWIHPDESWAGLQVDFIGPDDAFPRALSRLAGHPDLRCIDDSLPWFIPALTPGSVAAALALPGKQAILLVRSGENQDSVEAEVRRSGARAALVPHPGDPLPPRGAWDYIAMGVTHARALSQLQLREMAARFTLVATGLRSRNDFTWAMANHFSVATGEYLLSRPTASGKPDMLRLRLLKLLALIASDADTWEIEEIFRQEPKLAYGLLRLVNSAAIAPRGPINSFGQAINLLGRQQLQRWLQLLVYANSGEGEHANPLLLLAATRGRLLEILAASLDWPSDLDSPTEAAFMAGAFSLLDVLLHLPMAEILQQLPLPAEIVAALAEKRGPLGRLIRAVAAADNGEIDRASQLLASLGIDGGAFASAQLSALAWASHIRTPAP